MAPIDSSHGEPPPARIGTRRRSLAAGRALALALFTAACGRPGVGARSADVGSFRAVGVGANADPTVRGARLLPEHLGESVAYGSEPSGGSRAMMAGLRVVTSPRGVIVAADDRLPQPPQGTVTLPERLGGGFLFVLGSTLWRADRWLGPATPIFTASQPVQSVLAGLDRVYARTSNAVFALDGRTGRVLDLGPWPQSPYVASYAAADGWRAAAITDFRGVVATFDAGATWRALDLPFEAKQVVASGGNLAIGGFEASRTEAWYELRADESLARLGAAPLDVKVKLTPTGSTVARSTTSGGAPAPGGGAPPPSEHRPETTAARPAPRALTEDKEDLAAKMFGPRPLAAAIEDGWPLTDGTAVVARDGALARIRLSDGALTELVRDAFPLKPARCHPVSLTRPSAIGAFGFVCGEPRGATVIYAYEPLQGRLTELKRFDRPRVVASSGNGALAVRGPCAEDGVLPTPPGPEPARLKELDDKNKERAKEKDKPEGDGTYPARTDTSKDAPKSTSDEDTKSKTPPTHAIASDVRPYCVRGHDATWREVHVRGGADEERVVVLADGRIVVISPPPGIGATARITILDKGRATTAPIVFPRVSVDVARVLRLGLWLDGFEERRPGVVGGWIEAGGAMLGVEIALDGKGTPGQFIRDAGMPFVSGKYGLGWTASQRGYETTDGGMTWTALDLPDPLLPASKVERRACGPIGCVAHGWLRVGWGKAKQATPPNPPAAHRSTSSLAVPSVQLSCEPLAAMPPATPAPKARATSAAPAPSRVRLGAFGSPPVLGTFNGLSELPPFFSQAAPSLHESDRGINVDVRELVDRAPNLGSFARVYGWGPRAGDWDTLGRWQVKWLSPFAGWPEVRSSLPGLAPPIIVEMTKLSSGYGYGGYGSGYGSTSSFQVAPGDDPSHALLAGKRGMRSETVLYELEADRAPVEIRRADGEPFGEIEGVVRAAGRWFFATPPTSGAPAPITTIWQIEGAIARELVRVPRVSGENGSPARTKLARRSDGRAIALVADGQANAERAVGVRWALPVDLETGALGEPEPLGYTDLAGFTLDACTDDAVGWVFEAPISPARVRLQHANGAMTGIYARLRLTSERACIERLAGHYDGQTPDRASHLTRPGAMARSHGLRPGEVFVTAMSMQTRFPLRCLVTK